MTLLWPQGKVEHMWLNDGNRFRKISGVLHCESHRLCLLTYMEPSHSMWVLYVTKRLNIHEIDKTTSGGNRDHHYYYYIGGWFFMVLRTDLQGLMNAR